MADAKTDSLQQHAFEGNLEAQRKLADCYFHGCRGIAPDAVLACAWRIIVGASGNQGLTSADIESRRQQCEKLSPLEQAAAATEAKTIFAKIYGRELVLPQDFFGGNKPASRN